MQFKINNISLLSIFKQRISICVIATLAWVYYKRRGKVEMTDLYKTSCKKIMHLLCISLHIFVFPGNFK